MGHLNLAQAVKIINGGANSICPKEKAIGISLPALLRRSGLRFNCGVTFASRQNDLGIHN